ncbi:MAG: hypothetical protein K8T25_06575 [Planctomycetia bacterium]|nr:hypothetical protein [Planctomycetia bacterium]
MSIASNHAHAAPPTGQPDIAHDRLVAQIENRLHQNPGGIFVVVLSKAEQVYDKQRRRYTPVIGNYVEQYPDRHAAAEAVADCLVKFQTAKPKPGTPRGAGRPQFDFHSLGHYKTQEEAAAAVERARASYKTQGTLLTEVPSP